MSTYSWPDSSMSSYMISSVIERSTNRSSSMPSYREKSSGAPDDDADPPDLGQAAADRLDLVGADHRDRQHRDAGLERQPGDPGLAPVEPRRPESGCPPGRGRAASPRRSTLQPGLQRGLAGPAAGAVDRQLADALEEARGEPALDAATGEVVGLGEERHPALETSGRKIESENERWLLARIAPPSSGTFSSPRTHGRKIGEEHGAEDDPLEQPVEHGSPPGRLGSLHVARA